MKPRLSALFLFLSLAHASAQAVPNLLSYQGRVTDASGALIGNSAPVNRAVVFRLYSASSGGNALYAETQTVTISGGEFSVLIGNGTGVSGSPGPGSPATQPYKTLSEILNSASYSSIYLGITVDDGVPQTVDPEISPRQQLVSGAFALRAKVAEGVASGAVDTGMIGDSQVSTNKIAASAVTSAKIANSAVTANQIANSTITAAKIDTNSVGVWTPNGANVWRNGNVGIGEGNPGFPLNLSAGDGDKISLSGNSGNHFGFGVRAGVLQVHTATNSQDIAFGYGTSAGFGEILRIKGNGNVGIGTSNPGDKLVVSGGAMTITGMNGPTLNLFGNSGTATLSVAGANGDWSANAAAGDLVLRSTTGKVHLQYGGGAAALTVDTANKVGVGTSSPAAKFHVSEPTGTVAAANAGSMILDHENNGGASSILFRSKSNRGSDYGYIQYQDDADLGGGGETARLFIGTANDADDDVILQPSGRVGVKTTNTSQGTLSVSGGMVSVGSRNGTPGYARIVYENEGRIAFEGYNTSLNNGSWRGFSMDGNNDLDWRSDRRLKRNIVDAEPMLDRLMQLPFRRYLWRDSTDANASPEFGVIAQEVEPLFPDIIGRGDDGILTVGYTSFATIACKALQELKTRTDGELDAVDQRIEAAENSMQQQLDEKDARIADLEARLGALELLIRSGK